MTFQPGANLYTQGFGSRPESVEVPHYDVRPPAATDILYPIGKPWIDTLAKASYILVGLSVSDGVTSASWVSSAGGTTQLNQLTGDTGTAIPTAGSIQIAGGAGIVTSATGSVLTIDLEGGSVAMDSFVPDAGTNPVVPTALGAVTMAGTANQITTTGGTNSLTFSLPSAITAPGSLTTTTTLTGGTGITATTGDITATAGNVIINGAAKQLQVHGGAATDFIGTLTLTNGVSAAIANTNIAATDRIFLVRTDKNASTAYGSYDYAISAGASFQVTASKADTTTETGDQSTLAYFIVRQV